MNMRIKKLADTNSVKVTSRSTASLTKLADDLRDLTPKEYKQFIKLAKIFRKADKMAENWQQLDAVIGKVRTLSKREYKTCVKLSTDLRAMDKALADAEKLEKEMRTERMEIAQMCNWQ